MKRSHYLLLALLIPTPTFAQGLPPGQARALGFDPAKLDAITATLEKAIDDGQFAGISAIIVRNGQVAYIAAVGAADREAGVPMGTNTLARIASMTKPITSIAAMMLVEQGKLSLDDPLSKHLPEFTHMQVAVAPGNDPTSAPPMLVEADRPITIRHLLTHTSGLSYRFVGHPVLGKLFIEAAISDGLSETAGTQADNIKRLARLPLAFQPGTQWHYGLNTDVLGRVIEVVSGQSLEAFFKEQLFTPLKMNDTSFLVPHDKRHRLATVYGIEGGKPLARRPERLIQRGPLVYTTTFPTWDDNVGFYSGGAGLVSTLSDYARFVQMLLNHGELDGVRVLKPETVDAITSNQLGDIPFGAGNGFGFGFQIVGNSEAPNRLPAGSFSWGGFFSTSFWGDPRNQIAAVIFTQTHPAGPNSLYDDFMRLTYEALQP